MDKFQYLKNIFYFGVSVLVFFSGMVIYGIILNVGQTTLKKEMGKKGLTELKNVKLVISRSEYYLELFADSISVKKYKTVFGKKKSHEKTSRNDYVTPIGEYVICGIDTASQYHILLSLNYPNSKDASEALKKEIIANSEYHEINNSLKQNECPPSETKLGSNIGIHGIGDYDFIFKNLPFIFNWTNGSIAVNNRSIEEIFSVVKIGTQVTITN